MLLTTLELRKTSYWMVVSWWFHGDRAPTLVTSGLCSPSHVNLPRHLRQVQHRDGEQTPYFSQEMQYTMMNDFYLRKLQQTPGTYPRPSTTCLWRKSFHVCVLGYLGYVPRVCWKFLYIRDYHLGGGLSLFFLDVLMLTLILRRNDRGWDCAFFSGWFFILVTTK